MDPTPRLRWDGADRKMTNTGCGFIAAESEARAHWQSHMTKAGQRAEYPQLTNLHQLARSIRSGHASRPLQ